MPVEDPRAEAVAGDDNEQLAHGAEIGALDVEADEHGDTRGPGGEPGEASRAEPLPRAGGAGEDGTEDRHRGHDEGREGARQALLRRGEQVPRDDQLHGGVGEQRPPQGEDRRELSAVQGDRKEHERAERGPAADEHRRGDARGRHLDQQIRDPPDGTERAEQRPGGSAHGAAPCTPASRARHAEPVCRGRQAASPAASSGARSARRTSGGSRHPPLRSCTSPRPTGPMLASR